MNTRNSTFTAVEQIVSETASEAVSRVNAATSALKVAAEAVRNHSEKLKKAMDDADVSLLLLLLHSHETY